MIRGEVNVERLSVSIGDDEMGIGLSALRVNGRSVPVEHYEMIPEEPLAGDPLGCVNLHGKSCQSRDPDDHLHLVWINSDGDLRVSIVPRESRWDALPQIFVGA